MKEFLETATAVVPMIQSSPVWVKAYFSVWLLATIGLGLSVLFTYGSNSTGGVERAPINSKAPISTRAAPLWPKTGDAAIDKSHDALNALLNEPNPTEGQLIAALRNVFFKPVFKNIKEDSPDRALFTFCRGQLLLESYVAEFSSPGMRREIVNATQNLISLQDQLGALYGPAFSRDTQCHSHGDTL